MNSVFKYLVIIFIILISKNIYSASFEEAQEIIDIRKTTMQELWLRVKRLSPYVELKEKVDYNKDIASNDAQEIILLLEKAKDLWPSNTNLSGKAFTNATPAVWALPSYFGKLYSAAEVSAISLKEAINSDAIDDTAIAMCNLGKACGSCHANFRRLLTSQLANEVSGWSGQYIENCK
jgi:cytochrome c556